MYVNHAVGLSSIQRRASNRQDRPPLAVVWNMPTLQWAKMLRRDPARSVSTSRSGAVSRDAEVHVASP